MACLKIVPYKAKGLRPPCRFYRIFDRLDRAAERQDEDLQKHYAYLKLYVSLLNRTKISYTIVGRHAVARHSKQICDRSMEIWVAVENVHQAAGLLCDEGIFILYRRPLEGFHSYWSRVLWISKDSGLGKALTCLPKLGIRTPMLRLVQCQLYDLTPIPVSTRYAGLGDHVPARRATLQSMLSLLLTCNRLSLFWRLNCQTLGYWYSDIEALDKRCPSESIHLKYRALHDHLRRNYLGLCTPILISRSELRRFRRIRDDYETDLSKCERDQVEKVRSDGNDDLAKLWAETDSEITKREAEMLSRDVRLMQMVIWSRPEEPWQDVKWVIKQLLVEGLISNDGGSTRYRLTTLSM